MILHAIASTCKKTLEFMSNSTLQGKKNPSTDQEAIKSFLGLVKHAREMKIDRYHLRQIGHS